MYLCALYWKIYIMKPGEHTYLKIQIERVKQNNNIAQNCSTYSLNETHQIKDFMKMVKTKFKYCMTLPAEIYSTIFKHFGPLAVECILKQFY